MGGRAGLAQVSLSIRGLEKTTIFLPGQKLSRGTEVKLSSRVTSAWPLQKTHVATAELGAPD